jgi:hypothetical protein
LADNVGPGGDCTVVGELSAGYSVIGDASNCPSFSTGVQLGVDPLLSALTQVNGTWVHNLQPGSPALDAGDEGGCLDTDQAGHTRPQGWGCDVGAYESENFPIFFKYLPIGWGVPAP